VDSVQDGINAGAAALKSSIDRLPSSAQEAAAVFQKRAAKAADQVEANIYVANGGLLSFANLDFPAHLLCFLLWYDCCGNSD